MKVKALITAAGMGKRFGALTKKKNKCLLEVEGEALITHLLRNLRAAGIRSSWVVTGYEHGALKKLVYGDARTIFNPFYAVSGILGSFWAAKPALEGKAFLFTTSDHFFHPNVLRDCLRSKKDICIVVQTKKSYTKEDAKVTIENLHVTDIGKNLPVSRADGEFGGMVLFSARASKLFFQELSAHFEKGDPNGYMMEILLTVSRKYFLPIFYSLCGEDSRTEVDSVHDLVRARQMARKFRKHRF